MEIEERGGAATQATPQLRSPALPLSPETAAPGNGRPTLTEQIHALRQQRPDGRAGWDATWIIRRITMLCATAVCALAVCGPMAPSTQTLLNQAATARAELRYDQALAFDARAAAQAPGDARPSCDAGAVLALQQRWQAAMQMDQRCVAGDPGNVAGWMALAHADSAAGMASRARDAWLRAAELGATSAWRALAIQAEQQGEIGAAVRYWEHVPATSTEALAHLGILAACDGDFTLARHDFDLVQGTDTGLWLASSGYVAAVEGTAMSGKAGIFGQLGFQLLGNGLPALALTPLRSAVKLDPTNGSARAYLGWAEWLTGDQTAAQSDIQAGLRLAPDQSFAYFAAGELASAKGDHTGALALLRQGLSVDGTNPALWQAAGVEEDTLGDYAEADIAFAQAAASKTDPSFTVTLLHFYLNHRLGLTNNRALFAATTAMQQWPDNAEVRLLVGEVFDMLRQPSDAVYAFTAANQLDPRNPGPYVWLGKYAAAQGDYVYAALMLRTALALQPNGPWAVQARQQLAPLAAVQA